MVECRHCKSFFETPPEKIGARCPDCRMPLFERFERPRREVESGRCFRHPNSPGVATCQRCHQRLCVTCRTRWHEQNLCPECVERSLTAREEHPREIKAHRSQAVRGFLLALVSGGLFVLGLALLLHAADSPSPAFGSWGIALVFCGLVPASVALGHAIAAVLRRGPLLRLASSAVVLASGQIGVTLGLLFLNYLRN